MTQHLYSEQDSKDLDAKIKETFGSVKFKPETTIVPPVSRDGQVPKELTMAPRGMNSSIVHNDDGAFFEAPVNVQTPVQKSPPPPFDTMNHKVSFTDGGIQVKNTSTNTPSGLNLSPEMIRNAQAQLEEGGAVVLNNDGSKQMFTNIKEMFEAKANKPVTEKKTYFVETHSKFHVGIDKTSLEPLPIVRLAGKNFETKYLEQLESYIYNSASELDPDNLYILIYLMGIIEQNHFPLKLITGRHRHQLPRIVKTLNVFFNKNMTVLAGISKMFNGMTVQGVC